MGGLENKLINKKGWEWMAHYLTTNVIFMNMVQEYKISMTKAAKFKFGVELPKNANDALCIEKESSNKNWQLAIDLGV